MPKKLDKILYEAILEAAVLNKKDIEVLLSEAEQAKLSLDELLLNRGILNEDKILDMYSAKLKLSRVNLKELVIDKALIEKVPVKIASYYSFVPTALKDRNLFIAVSRPLDIKIQDEIRTQLGYNLQLQLAPLQQVKDALKKYYGLGAETLDKISGQMGKTASGLSQDNVYSQVEDLEKLAEDASVIQLVNQIILEAHRKRATDIHIEPFRDSVSLRYRIDGILYEAPVPTEIKSYLNAIISRIKIMSNLNIVERRLPQDGRAIVKIGEQMLDLRISTIPTPFGESVVIRILPTTMLFSLEKLGLARRELQIFESLIQKPHGIVFVTGPTGSGKTTTLYACLSRINTKDRKIITIEDPIEYEMRGITQIQVMPEIGLDFARGLRSILRHDPDVVMVGEVRDYETAETAIRMALTGHLVFSTLHTNDAPSGITRLIDIGVEPYLLASSVEAFIAQRLVRLICPECKAEDISTSAEIKKIMAKDLGLQAPEAIKVFRGKGCSQCNFTGFLGRTAIYEILLVDSEIRDLILKKASSEEIKKLALRKGMRTLRQDGWQKVFNGLTTPEEILKVTTSEEELASAGNKEWEDSKNFFAIEKKSSFFFEDKRVYPRLDLQAHVSYKLVKTEELATKGAFSPEGDSASKNISAGGLLLITTESLPVGTILELKIELPDGQKPIECLARVVRVEQTSQENIFDTAVCFLDLTSSQRARLDNFINQKIR